MFQTQMKEFLKHQMTLKKKKKSSSSSSNFNSFFGERCGNLFFAVQCKRENTLGLFPFKTNSTSQTSSWKKNSIFWLDVARNGSSILYIFVQHTENTITLKC